MEGDIRTYFDKVDFAVTVCDNDGTVLYQNSCAVDRDGNAEGMNLFGCHSMESCAVIRDMIATGRCSDREVVENGIRRLVHRTPWYDGKGNRAGLVEISVGIPSGKSNE